jgi:hypothetical protein
MIHSQRQFSDNGFVVVANTSALATGKYSGIQVLSEAVIASITYEPGYSGDTALQTQTLPAGLYRPMLFTTLTLTSGVIVAEKL